MITVVGKRGERTTLKGGRGDCLFITGLLANRTKTSEMLRLLSVLACIGCVWGHARLMEPPSRASMWRFGFENPRNYDDDGLYCGGMNIHWKQNGGKCGVCGDPWHITPPRPNENGGKFGNGIIVRNYKPGQVIQTVVDITANHRGYFEFRICANKNRKKEVTQECLDQNLLTILNVSSTQYHVGEHGRSRVQLALRLPQGFSCKYCVFQWTYVAGNNWGRCKNGTFGLGCGSQETFKSCADVTISGRASPHDPSPSPSTSSTTPFPTTSTPKPTKGTWQGNDDRKKPPTYRPHVVKGETFEEALKRLLQDPRLRWMVKPKKANAELDV